jgi:hypothetical protein
LTLFRERRDHFVDGDSGQSSQSVDRLLAQLRRGFAVAQD